MAAKDLMKNLKKDPHTATKAPAPAAVAPAEPKKKTGRPKTKLGEYKNINISVPVDVIEKMEVAKLKHGNSITSYINAIIKADLEANFDKYLQLQELLNS